MQELQRKSVNTTQIYNYAGNILWKHQSWKLSLQIDQQFMETQLCSRSMGEDVCWNTGKTSAAKFGG